MEGKFEIIYLRHIFFAIFHNFSTCSSCRNLAGISSSTPDHKIDIFYLTICLGIGAGLMRFQPAFRGLSFELFSARLINMGRKWGLIVRVLFLRLAYYSVRVPVVGKDTKQQNFFIDNM